PGEGICQSFGIDEARFAYHPADAYQPRHQKHRTWNEYRTNNVQNGSREHIEVKTGRTLESAVAVKGHGSQVKQWPVDEWQDVQFNPRNPPPGCVDNISSAMDIRAS